MSQKYCHLLISRCNFESYVLWESVNKQVKLFLNRLFCIKKIKKWQYLCCIVYISVVSNSILDNAGMYSRHIINRSVKHGARDTVRMLQFFDYFLTFLFESLNSKAGPQTCYNCQKLIANSIKEDWYYLIKIDGWSYNPWTY